ncbi:MiaB/RimO family radical SAM methylthiotransferase [Myxococcota bacterium]|nr:MiaB/RimO family radical SAM methylthiotransferase [Myxococcota bacterium]
MTRSGRQFDGQTDGRPIRVAFRTTGCKVNQFDTTSVMTALADLPIEFCHPDEGADLVVVNACTVTMKADRDGRAYAYRAARTGARVLLAGCLATRIADSCESMPNGIEVSPGTADRTALVTRIASLVEEMLRQRASDEDRTDDDGRPGGISGGSLPESAEDEDGVGLSRSRPLVKIQDGCDCRCSYCIVPLVRGPSRSVSIQDVTRQVEAASLAGAAEVVLTGVDLAAWGRTDDGRYGHLHDLLKHLTAMGTSMRFRLSSLEPYGLDDDLVDSIASNPDICPHLHIPMQSGADTVLSRMNRPYSSARFRDLVSRAAGAIPGLVLGMDVIAGFPGESDEEFDQTRAMIRDLPTTYLHVFPYSPRPGTPAAVAPNQVPVEVKRMRGRVLREFGQRRRKTHVASLEGSLVEVVDIRPVSGGVEALAADYTRVLIPNAPAMRDGRRMIRIIGSNETTAIGKELE